jgi:hypothetical protein
MVQRLTAIRLSKQLELKKKQNDIAMAQKIVKNSENL